MEKKEIIRLDVCDHNYVFMGVVTKQGDGNWKLEDYIYTGSQPSIGGGPGVGITPGGMSGGGMVVTIITEKAKFYQCEKCLTKEIRPID